MILNCEFTEPIELTEGDFEFSKLDCEEAGTTIITDGEYTAFISSKLDLGDIFIIGFLMMFLGILIFKFIWDFIFPKILKVKSIRDL